MKRLLHKRITKKGFTLAELLIVVAILAILVAVSIPIFTAKLADAKKATDEANMRACKALVANAIITGEFSNSSWYSPSVGGNHFANYDAENGCLVSTMAGSSVKGYGQGSKIKGETNAPAGSGFYTFINESEDALSAQEGFYLTVAVEEETGYYMIYWVTP